MNKYKLITIVTEAALEITLLDELEKLGARGYTLSDVRGKGQRGVRNANWEASANIRIEVVCEASVAKAVASHLQENYYDNYAMIFFSSDVEVLRDNKFRI